MKNNSTLLILSLIMVINALAYGVIIPLLYPYAARFGIDAFWLSLLFISFSLFQFISTPIMGRLSDRYGRKPLLVISLFGTSLSLAMFASATSVPMLFLARILDGITGGNISVAQAVIADSTTGADRAKSMGMLGAAFGFGFLVGPALGGLLSQYGLTAPFWFAAGLGLVGAILSALFLPETLKKTVRKEAKHEKFFDPQHLVKALTNPIVGTVFLVTFLTAIAQNSFVIGFQTFSVDVLHLNARSIGLQFATFGFISILMQAVGIKTLLKLVPDKRHVLQGSVMLSAVAMVLLTMQENLIYFTAANVFFSFVSAPLFVLLAGMISERSNKEDQGAMLGINQSYMSLGQIVGPLLAGLATKVSISATFGVAAVFYFISLLVTARITAKSKTFDL